MFAQPFIDESNALDFELREIYQSLLLLRGHLNLCGSQVAEGHNIFFATFRTAEKRMHTVSAVQLAQGDPINCFATIGDANKLSKQQIIDVLKQFHYNGVLFSAGINEDNELVAQIVYPQPPREAAAVCTGMLSLAKFGDTVERDFFGADLN